MNRSTFPSSRGFTLIEAIATMAILAVVSLSASRIIFAAADAYAADATRSELTLDQSAAMERITSELRGVPARDTAPGTPWIDSVSSSMISFGGDSEMQLSGTTLTLLNDGGPARIVLKNVTAFSLACFDEAGQAITLPVSGSGCDPIRRIQVMMTCTRHGVTESLRTRVFLRCAVGQGGCGE